ncbi:inhibitor of prohead protease [Aeromonas phage AS-zj]|uniref:Inhibitor of prohead protease n=1 Tax=Aeromonas phage AS-zj TaxID=2024208 RepID=A0A223LEH7_9CAUD|nr:minor head protein inhibitor of protease [Aeromonas phage AS-zj]ASU00161.1 inhibitor of prohead protease [Aeromonas phage AS-zj]
MALNYVEEPVEKETKPKKSTVKKQKELDLGVINEIVDANTAPEAKAKIQAYAKECGFKISKSNTSVDDMIVKLLEMADAKENEKLDLAPEPKEKTPFVEPVVVDDEFDNVDEVIELGVVESIKIDDGVVNINTPNDVKIEFTPPKQPEYIDSSGFKTLDELIEDEKKFVKEKMNLETTKDTQEPDLTYGFKPKVNLIGAVGNQYLNCPYWILDWILEKGPSWKSIIDTHEREPDKALLKTVLYYIQINGSVTLRESRNSRFHTIY